MLQLGYDEHEIFDNVIEWNRSVGLVYVGHQLLDGNIDNPDKRMDLYPEAVHVYRNTFTSNGTLPQPPEASVIVCADGTGPGFDDVPPCVPIGVNDSDTSLLPALIQIKGALAAQNGDPYGPTGAHIVWDGYFDSGPYACTNPLGSDPASVAEFASILDENGKPQYTGAHNPSCRYNAFKFTGGVRKAKFTTACIESDNSFSADSRTYMNFAGTDPTVGAGHRRVARRVPPNTLDPVDAAVVEGLSARGARAAAAVTGGDRGDLLPTTAATRSTAQRCSTTASTCRTTTCSPIPPIRAAARTRAGRRFELTTQLFSDYAKKYRFVFLPPGGQASWNEGSASAPNATLGFPVGTVIAETFAFPNGANEEVVETRLLIHRTKATGGLPTGRALAFIWDKDGSGNRTDAPPRDRGRHRVRPWNYEDPDPDVTKTYVGSTDRLPDPAREPVRGPVT
jgi:hypothetical protein